MDATIVDIGCRHAERRASDTAFVFLDSRLRPSSSYTFRSLNDAVRDVAAYIQQFDVAGDRALLLLSAEADFVRAFFGCVYAGVVAVPAYPPINDKPTHRTRIEAIIRDAGVRLILTDEPYYGRVLAWLKEFGLQESIRCIALATIGSDGGSWKMPDLRSTDTAFLQYTSGSTRAPRGVAVTHANILANQSQIQRAFGHHENATIASWLPLFHDMGLIGHVLHPFYLGAKSILMSPMTFLSQPVNWLEVVSSHRVTTSGGPNFGYQLCADRISNEQAEAFDLSTWSVAYVGAEPVRSATLEAFVAKFSCRGFRREALLPCYGLAEATLFVAGAKREAAPIATTFDRAALQSGRVKAAETQAVTDASGHAGRRLVASGWVGTGQSIAIVNPQTERRCATDEVGEIWVRNESIAAGYWSPRALSALSFCARIVDDGDCAWLRTGDLGFVHDEHLYVEGRIKDLIIIRGRNHAPQDIELTVCASDPALVRDAGVAFSVEIADEERLVVVQEVARSALRRSEPSEVMDRIREHVAREHDLRIHEIVLIKPATLSKTSSGKVQRGRMRERYLAGNDLDVVARSCAVNSSFPAKVADPGSPRLTPQTSVEIELARIATDVLDLEVGTDADFFRLGLDSLAATQLIAAVRTSFDVALTTQDLYAHPTLRGIAEKVERLLDLQSIHDNAAKECAFAGARLTIEI